jgi:SIR2-like domain
MMTLEEDDWEALLDRITTGECTPFLGAAVNHGILPLGGDIAKEWADTYMFPLQDGRTNLAKVAQFIAVRNDPMRPKELILKKLAKPQKPFNFDDNSEPLNVLAKLPLPIYITTNYDNLLLEAIEHHGIATNRKPDFEICKWNNSSSVKPRLFESGSQFEPTPQMPVIYHLHGHQSVKDSLVLTEDDYLDFLVNMSKSDIKDFLPPCIQAAITRSSIIFIGYSLEDIDFRVLFRGLLGNLDAALGVMSVAVQLPYDKSDPNKEKAEEYIAKYFTNVASAKVKVYWGKAKEFAEELGSRWEKFNDRK